MRRSLLALPLLLAALAFAACGDSSDNESAATPAATQEATEAPTEAPTETATESGGSSSTKVKVTGKLGEKPKIESPGGAPPTELVTKDIEKGKGAEAKSGDNVSVQYVGALYKDGTVFDNSWDRGEPFQFGLGQQQVIPGWDQGVAGMKVGGRRLLVIPPDLGYGAQGTPDGTIPPDSTLIFVVDLEKIS